MNPLNVKIKIVTCLQEDFRKRELKENRKYFLIDKERG